MKRLLLLYTTIFTVNLVIIMAVLQLAGIGKIGQDSLRAYYSFSGIKQHADGIDVLTNTSAGEVGGEDVVIQQNTAYSYFSSIETFNADYFAKVPPKVDDRVALYEQTDISGIALDSDMKFHNGFREMPLHPSDYYEGKFTNASAGVRQINTIPILKPGDSVGIIADGYVNIKYKYGYIDPPHYVYGSGVCWATSAMGAMFDDVNATFKNKYGVDLFVYKYGDRAPHGGFYKTYTNNNHGYTILQHGDGSAAQDYRININPALKNIEALKDLKIKVVMLYTDKHPVGYAGESIAGYLVSNIEF